MVLRWLREGRLQQRCLAPSHPNAEDTAAEDLAAVGYPGLLDGRRVTGLQGSAVTDEKLMFWENVEPRVYFLFEILYGTVRR